MIHEGLAALAGGGPVNLGAAWAATKSKQTNEFSKFVTKKKDFFRENVKQTCKWIGSGWSGRGRQNSGY